jgi:hypothetical protein
VISFLAFFETVVGLCGGTIVEERLGGLLIGLKSWGGVALRFFLGVLGTFYCGLCCVTLTFSVRLITSPTSLPSSLSPSLLSSERGLGRFRLASFLKRSVKLV